MAQSKVEVITGKLTAAQTLVAKYTAELEALNRASNIAAGTIVSFTFGRGDKATTLTGKVLATGTQSNGVAVATVLVNEGTIDADVKRIPISSIAATVEGGYSVDAPAPTTDPLGCVVTSESPTNTGDPLAQDASVQNVDALLN